MKLLSNSRSLSELSNGCVAAIGNFDGVHKGHQNLLTLLKQEAIKRNLPLLVILFEPQPNEFFLTNAAPARLYTLREKITHLENCGVDYVCKLKFNDSLANMAPNDFAEQIIFKKLNIKYLLIGQDFRFGYKRLGDGDLLKQIGAAWSAEIVTCDNFLHDNQRVSSTKIRQTLANSQFKLAEELLGRPYAITGRVIYGQQLARLWGVPTANIALQNKPIAIGGVFCVQVQRLSNNTTHIGVANIGYRPTVNGKKLLLEVHLLESNESLYNEKLKVIFLHKLRNEIKFASIEQLKNQIYLDVQQAKEYFMSVYNYVEL